MQQAETQLLDEQMPESAGDRVPTAGRRNPSAMAQAAGPGALPVEPAEVIWTIGAAADCDIRLDVATDYIACLIKRGPRVFVRKLGSQEAVLVNGTPLSKGDSQELTHRDDLNVAGTTIVLEPRHFFTGLPLGLDTSRLYARLPHDANGRLLCEGAYLRAQPGTLTVILGPVGCGKSVFLSLLNGDLMPSEGRVLIGGRFDLWRDADRLNGCIGYVPQGDVLIPELTVCQSLDCRLRLRFPDMAAEVRRSIILDTCRQVGVSEAKLDTFLNAQIGTADGTPRGLSGGERRLANIAHELLLRPRILLLDEPTSGLDSTDAELVVRLLKELATEQNITVVATMHQPSRESFAHFDDLLVMVEGGRLAFYGPATGAVEFFERASDLPCPSESNPAAFILERASQADEAGRLVQFHQAHPCVQPLENDAGIASAGADGNRSRRPGHFCAKLATLLWRNLLVLRADKFNVRLTFGQVPLIALLLVLAFGGIHQDGAGFEQLARRAWFFTVGKEPYQQQGRPVPVEQLLADAEAGETYMLSTPAARRRGGVYFVLVAASVWFGILGGCREIVSEKPVLRRECKVGLDLAPYLAGKTATLAALTGLQTAGLTVLTVPVLLGHSLPCLAATWCVLWLVAVAASSLGLLVSCLSPTQRFALTAVPLLMIPQMVLGGMVRPAADMAEDRWLPRALSWMTLQRWGFEAVLHFDTFGTTGVMIQECTPETASRYGALDWVRLSDGSLPECFFGRHGRAVSLALPVAVLMLSNGLLLAAARAQLRRSVKPYAPTQP